MDKLIKFIDKYWYVFSVTIMILWIIYWLVVLFSLLFQMWLDERLVTGEQYHELLKVCGGNNL